MLLVRHGTGSARFRLFPELGEPVGRAECPLLLLREIGDARFGRLHGG
jgi:hypothetical protein